MIKKYKYFLFLILSGLFILLSYFTNKYFERDSQYRLDTKVIEKRISQLDKDLDIFLSEYTNQLKKNIDTTAHKKDINYFNVLSIPSLQNFTFLIYQNDTLRYWSENSFPAKYYFPDYKSINIIHAKNGWYRAKLSKLKGFKILGLYRIKNTFFYKNQYLKSNFTLDTDIPMSVVMSVSPISIGKNIKDPEGNYLFSLIPSNNITAKKSNHEIPFLLFAFALIFFTLFSDKLIKRINKYKHSYLISSLVWVLTLLIFIITEKLKLTIFISDSTFFSKEIYEGTFPFSDIGNIFFSTIFIVFTAKNLFNILPIEEFYEKLSEKNKIYEYLILAIAFFFFAFIFKEISSLLKELILNSSLTFNVQKAINPDINGFIFFISITVLYLSIIFVSDALIHLAERVTNIKITILSFIISLFGMIIFFIIFSDSNEFLSISTFYLILVFIILIRYFKESYSYFSLLGIIFIFTVFISIFSDTYMQKKLEQKEKELIKLLANDTDPIAERFLKEINQRLNNDTILLNKIINVTKNQDLDIYDYMRRKYFYGFWEKYDLEISLCGNTEFYRNENQAENCEGYYNLEVKNFGDEIENTKFWLMHYNTGKITYFGIVDVPVKIDKREMSLYITLSEKLTAKVLGYPALLIDKSTKTKKEFNDYSYAKYSNGILAVKFGEYPYELNDKEFVGQNKPEYYIFSNKYSHLIYAGNKEKLIVLSKEKSTFFNKIISFTYLFVFFNVLILIFVVFYDYHYILKRFKFDFKNKIRFSMIFILLISFILFGVGSVYFTIKQNEKTNNREMKEKVQSVLIELKHKLQYENELTPNWHTEQYDHLDELLNKFSQVFFADINLYDLNGILLASSRSEIFNRGLLSKEMHPKAFFELVSEGKTEFIQKEHISNMEYSSVYIPLRNENNKIIAFINLPYFSDTNKVKKNISDVLMTILNLYLVLFLLTAFLSVLISEQIIKPLTLLQSKFKSIQLGKKHKQIIYNKQDEIGALVKEYNLMVAKLEESANKLAETERESAWREMAKQIAHEIKNPLTPMKLSIQLLQKTWYDKTMPDKDFENRLNKVAQTLIEQINTLSSIASEFSAFAKMPKTRNEEVEIVKKLKNVTALFENENNIDISLKLNGIEELYIIADKEQVSRVFINLVKNAMQAIPKSRKGKILIQLEKGKNKAIIIIEDNGEGISEQQKKRLFEPSFTTKTTGMGIGLAIVKNIITAAGGNIRFESSKNKGAKFFVEFITV